MTALQYLLKKHAKKENFVQAERSTVMTVRHYLKKCNFTEPIELLI